MIITYDTPAAVAPDAFQISSSFLWATHTCSRSYQPYPYFPYGLAAMRDIPYTTSQRSHDTPTDIS